MPRRRLRARNRLRQERRAAICEVLSPIDVVLIELRVNEHLASHWMLHGKCFQPIAELAASVRTIDDSRRSNTTPTLTSPSSSGIHPPAVTDHMILPSAEFCRYPLALLPKIYVNRCNACCDAEDQFSLCQALTSSGRPCNRATT